MRGTIRESLTEQGGKSDASRAATLTARVNAIVNTELNFIVSDEPK